MGNNKVLNPNGTENIDNAFIGNMNPFRYRSPVTTMPKLTDS
jgi:hypothetical protein